jgi:hypothetical protein
MGPKKCFHLGSALCSKKIVDGPINMALSKLKKEEAMNTPMNQLI